MVNEEKEIQTEVMPDEELTNVAGGCGKEKKPTSYQGHPLVNYDTPGPCAYGLWAPRTPDYEHSQASGCTSCVHSHFHGMFNGEPSCYCDARTI